VSSGIITELGTDTHLVGGSLECGTQSVSRVGRVEESCIESTSRRDTPTPPFPLLAVIEGAKPPSSASVEDASREGIQRPHELLARSPPGLLLLRSNGVVRCSPRLRRCSSATRSAHCRLWPSVHPVGVGHSEPPVKGSRLRSLEPLCPRRVQVPTQKQEALSSTSEGRVAPSAVGQGSSPQSSSEDRIPRPTPPLPLLADCRR
jgi:hypothetical protein